MTLFWSPSFLHRFLYPIRMELQINSGSDQCHNSDTKICNGRISSGSSSGNYDKVEEEETCSSRSKKGKGRIMYDKVRKTKINCVLFFTNFEFCGRSYSLIIFFAELSHEVLQVCCLTAKTSRFSSTRLGMYFGCSQVVETCDPGSA